MTDEKEDRQGVGKPDRERLAIEKPFARKGRKGFLPGNWGGNGRPPRDVENTYAWITYQRCTHSEWAAIIDKAIEQARRGDKDARNFLRDCLGADQELWMGVEPSMERVRYWIKKLMERKAEAERGTIDVTPEKKD